MSKNNYDYAVEQARSVMAEIIQAFRKKDPRGFCEYIIGHETNEDGTETYLRVWGGPAVRIAFERDRHGRPVNVRLEFCDWWLPWKSWTANVREQRALDWIAEQLQS